MAAAVLVFVMVLGLWAVGDEVGRRWGWADRWLDRLLGGQESWSPGGRGRCGRES